jgi:hypothetical protein
MGGTDGFLSAAPKATGMVSYLTRDEAGFITGASLTIDGGFAL